jgi:hypothetical protein
MKKRKTDTIFEQSLYYTNENAKNRLLIPLDYDDESIEFKYYDDWYLTFPNYLSEEIIKLILYHITPYDKLKQRTLNNKHLCCVCGLMEKTRNLQDVRCSRCLCYFCDFCWNESNLIPDHHRRSLTMGLDHMPMIEKTIGENKKSKKKSCLYVRYGDCPGCCAGLIFDETITC